MDYFIILKEIMITINKSSTYIITQKPHFYDTKLALLLYMKYPNSFCIIHILLFLIFIV